MNTTFEGFRRRYKNTKTLYLLKTRLIAKIFDENCIHTRRNVLELTATKVLQSPYHENDLIKIVLFYFQS